MHLPVRTPHQPAIRAGSKPPGQRFIARSQHSAVLLCALHAAACPPRIGPWLGQGWVKTVPFQARKGGDNLRSYNLPAAEVGTSAPAAAVTRAPSLNAHASSWKPQQRLCSPSPTACLTGTAAVAEAPAPPPPPGLSVALTLCCWPMRVLRTRDTDMDSNSLLRIAMLLRSSSNEPPKGLRKQTHDKQVERGESAQGREQTLESKLEGAGAHQGASRRTTSKLDRARAHKGASRGTTSKLDGARAQKGTRAGGGISPTMCSLQGRRQERVSQCYPEFIIHRFFHWTAPN
eukprot:217105-Chlamydomonas_euryale.AAC.3